MPLSINHMGKHYSNWAPADLLSSGVPSLVVAVALKAEAVQKISANAEGYRQRFDEISAGRLAEYRVKERIASDPASASEEELALIDREAAARGLDRQGLLTLISTKAGQLDIILLTVGAIEAEAKKAVSDVPDDAADIETQISTVLATAQGQADQAYDQAIALINGGS